MAGPPPTVNPFLVNDSNSLTTWVELAKLASTPINPYKVTFTEAMKTTVKMPKPKFKLDPAEEEDPPPEEPISDESLGPKYKYAIKEGSLLVRFPTEWSLLGGKAAFNHMVPLTKGAAFTPPKLTGIFTGLRYEEPVLAYCCFRGGGSVLHIQVAYGPNQNMVPLAYARLDFMTSDLPQDAIKEIQACPVVQSLAMSGTEYLKLECKANTIRTKSFILVIW